MSDTLDALTYSMALIRDRLTLEAPANRERLGDFLDSLGALHQRLACPACEGGGSGMVHGVGGSCSACNGTGIKPSGPA